MRWNPDRRFELGGYALWLVGSAFFMVTSARNDDLLGFGGATLFLVGIVLVMVPMFSDEDERS